jgi:hypothetical protein
VHDAELEDLFDDHVVAKVRPGRARLPVLAW